jgi:hypothetical protein
MSTVRPECSTDHSGRPTFSHDAAYFRILQAVAKRRSLIHGRLHRGGHSCAIGCAFDDGVESLPNTVIDEIATYNDSFPNLTAHERWRKVMAWLRFEVGRMREGKRK